MRTISVVIITQNEEVKTVRAIQSCQKFADEVVVVDGGSKDETVKRAKELGCAVFINLWPGYAKQRNFGAAKANFNWIFMLDSDEVVDEILANSLISWKARSPDGKQAYRIQRVGNFFNTWLENTHDEPIRLYEKEKVQIRDVVVHESPNVEDAFVGNLNGIIWHYGFRSIHDHVRRFNKYTDLDAQELFRQGKRYSFLRLTGRPIARFIQKYFIQRMCFKGVAGLSVSLLWIYYEIMRELKLYEIDVMNSSSATK